MKQTCFLIDDDADDHEIFRIVLHQVAPEMILETFLDGEEALRKLVTEDGFSPDYIFLDLNMPGMNGKECLAALRQMPRLNNTPIIIYSTSNYEMDMINTKALGATHYLEKQSSLGMLKTKLEGLLKK